MNPAAPPAALPPFHFQAVFLDRDGTIIQDNGYPKTLADSPVYDFAAEAVRIFNQLGYKVIIITNQSGVARNYLSISDVEAMNRDLTERLKQQGAVIDAVYYCPCHPDGIVPAYAKESGDRKPNPGMLLQAARDLKLNLNQCLTAGDMKRDLEAGRNAGCKTALLRTGKGAETERTLKNDPNGPHFWADFITDNILTLAITLKENRFPF